MARRAGSGRQKGTRNKRTDELTEKLAALGHDTVAGLLLMLKKPGLKEEVRAKILCELMQYEWPKRKAIEHSGEVKEFCTLTITGA